MFLISKPSPSCVHGGLGKYQHLMQIQNQRSINYMIEAFHAPLNTTEDHIRAVESARNLCDDMTEKARKYLGRLGLISAQDIRKFTIYAYSPLYVYYNQYIGLWIWARITKAVAMAAIFGVHFLVGGFNWLVALSLITSMYMIGVHILFFMYAFDVNATESTLGFVTICMGIAPRFVIFFIDRFAMSMQKLAVERQATAVQVMARPVVCGVIGNKLFWLVPFWLAEADYCKLFAGMCLSGTFFGVLYVPTIIYFLGWLENALEIICVYSEVETFG